EPGPIEALAVLGDGPAMDVEATRQRVDADHIGAELRERHARRGRRHEGAALDDAKVREHATHAASTTSATIAAEPSGLTAVRRTLRPSAAGQPRRRNGLGENSGRLARKENSVTRADGRSRRSRSSSKVAISGPCTMRPG